MTYTADLLRVVDLMRAEAPTTSLLAVVDQIQAAGRDHPDEVMREALEAFCAGAVAAAGTSDRETWQRFAVAIQAVRVVGEAVSDTRRPL